MSLIKSFFTVSFFTLLSRILGFVRDVLIASNLGAGPLMEAFLVAFKLPNFFRRLFAEGAFSAAFVPMFSGILEADGKETAQKFAEQIQSVLLTSLLVFTVLMELGMGYVMFVIAPGFVDDPEKLQLATLLTRITFPYLLFISLVSLMAGVLNGVGRFAAMASAPIILNICLIFAVTILDNYTETSAHALAISVFAAGVLQMLWLLIATWRAGFFLRLRLPRISPDTKIFLKKMLPGIFGAGITQINLWIDIVIGTFIPSAIAYLYYADRINQLPLAIIGTAMGMALLPSLSKSIKAGNKKQASESQNRALQLVLFLTVPACFALCTISYEIISALFQHGEFSKEAAIASSYALVAYAIGLPAFALIKILVTGFFANGDTKTPVVIATICLVINVVLNISFVLSFPKLGFMPHIGLALATSIAAWLNVLLLSKGLKKRNSLDVSKQTWTVIFKTIFAGAIMSGSLILVNYLLGDINKIILLVAEISSGIVMFFLVSAILRTYKLSSLKNILRGR